MIIDEQFRSSSLFLFQEALVSIPVLQFSELPFIPAGGFGEVTCNPGDAVHIPGTAVGTGGPKPSRRTMAEVARCELGREGDLVILSPLKCFDDKIGHGRLRRLGLP